MTRFWTYGAAFALVLAQSTLFIGGVRAEGGSISDLNAERYAQAARCDSLSRQFHERVGTAAVSVTAKAKDMASQGEALCRLGNTTEGATTLQKAVDAISAPGK